VAEITALMVKELREKTGAGMMECKKALVEAGGDQEKAVDVLRKQGLATAAKKATRSAKQGLIGHSVTADAKLAVIAEVNCESDFVARTDDFQALVKEVITLVADHAPADVPALLALPSAEAGQTVGQAISAKIAKVGENMGVARFARLAASATGYLTAYIHPGSQLGVVVEMTAGKPETAASAAFLELLHDVAMQVAAANPGFLSRADVTAEILEKEKEIYRARTLAEGKPEKVVDKIVEGRMAKFYEEVCLLDQPFIKENSLSVTQLLAQKGKELGDTLGVARFVRFKVGETQAAEAAQ
jgi:elongation factor Ts